jgi:hypothetical protein
LPGTNVAYQKLTKLNLNQIGPEAPRVRIKESSTKNRNKLHSLLICNFSPFGGKNKIYENQYSFHSEVVKKVYFHSLARVCYFFHQPKIYMAGVLLGICSMKLLGTKLQNKTA